MTHHRARRLAALVIAATAGATAAVAVLPAASASASTITVHSSTKTTITRGVQRWSISWTNLHGYQHGYVMSVDLTVKGISMRPGLGHGVLNDRETTEGIADRTGAIAGINGDLFSWDTSLPWGGVALGGSVLRTPKPNRPSQFFITSQGKAGIGTLDWSGSATQVSSTGKLGASRAIIAVNAPGAADNGRLTLLTPKINGGALARCPAVVGTVSGRTLTVKRVYSRLGRFSRLTSGHVMLAACYDSGSWLLAHAPVNQRLRLAQHITTPNGTPVTSFISGQRTLRLGGQPYRDTTGFHTAGINPETAACVSRDREHVLLISVDGWLGSLGLGNGITLHELGDLTAALNCWSAVVFDGGGSTTLVERRSGTLHVVNQVPTWYGQRPVPNALLVFKS